MPSLEGILELCQRLLEADHPSEQLDLLVEGAIELLRAESGYLVRHGEDGLVFHRRWGSRPEAGPEPVSLHIVEDALRSPHPILVEDASRDPRYAARASVVDHGLRSVLAAAVTAEEPVALYLESGSTPLGREHLDLFRRIVAVATPILERSVRQLRSQQTQELFERYDFSGIVARDEAMHAVLERVAKVAPTDYAVLILGPTGSGKEVVAEALHRNSARRDQPLAVVNCGAISSTLLESQLFGHERGAFTGADRAQPGIVRSADGGTLLLDEIAEIPLDLQSKLLRTLQNGEVQPVGSPRPVEVDVRFLASTHRDLEQEVEAGRFREDLYQRLNVLRVEVPGLEVRPRDVIPLFEHFLHVACRNQGGEVPRLEDDAVEALLSHEWPGNVRELEHEAVRVSVLHRGDRVRADMLSFVRENAGAALSTLEQAERELIRKHLAATRGNRSAAARALGISREGLRLKMQRYEIDEGSN